jgi:hypothetical protein
MSAAPAAPWQRLAWLTLLVLAVHLAVLLRRPHDAGPVPPSPVHLVTRMIAPPAPPPPAPPPAAPAPAPAAPAAQPAERRPARERAPVAPAPRTAATPAAPELSAAPPADSGAPAAQAAPPADSRPRTYAVMGPRRLFYTVTVQTRDREIEGEARLDWRHDGREYEATLEMKGRDLPTRVQRSIGQVSEQGLAPSYFSDKGRAEQATHFERDKGVVIFSNNQPQAQLAPGIQDRLSAVLQLAAMVAADPERYPPGTLITLPTASTREVDDWVFSVEEPGELVLAGDRVPALKLQHLPQKSFDQAVELWLAPLMDYAPVRVRLTNPNGDVIDQRWTSTDKG